MARACRGRNDVRLRGTRVTLHAPSAYHDCRFFLNAQMLINRDAWNACPNSKARGGRGDAIEKRTSSASPSAAGWHIETPGPMRGQGLLRMAPNTMATRGGNAFGRWRQNAGDLE